MVFSDTGIAGAYVVETERYTDERGFFARVWCADELAALGLTASLAQSSVSFNRHAGTLRGMHFQQSPHAEAKLVRCIRGALFDVALDLRTESPTYLQWHGVTLDAEHGNGFFIPEGCAHGFQTLVDGTEAIYFISHPYASAASSGVRWDDPAFGIEWPSAPERIMSERDRSWPDYFA